MLNTLKRTFTAPAAAIGLASVTMLSGGAYAEDAAPVVAANSSAATPSAAEMEIILERNGVIKDAASFAQSNPGKIGISILEGSDTDGMDAGFMIDALKNGLSQSFGLGAEGFVGDNGAKATEISYAYAFYNSGTEKMDVMVQGPYNADQAIPMAKEVASIVQAQAALFGVSYEPSR